MKRKLIAFTGPAGVLLFVLYLLLQRVVRIPDPLAYLWMLLSCLCMVCGLIYNGYCLGKGKKPFDFH